MDNLKLKVLMPLITYLLGQLKPEMVTRVLDALLDKVETIIAESPSNVDDVVVGGIISTIRVALNIPDGDD